MKRAVTLSAVAVVLAGPTALAFFSGGYFDLPRLIAGLVAWALVAVAAIVSDRPLPASRPGRVAVAGLALLSAWTGLSIAWAPLAGPATDDFTRTLLYLAAFVAAAGLLRGQARRRAVEPALALGSLVVIVYGLAGRVLPGVVDLEATVRATGRLQQPLTYWNAEGVLAAMGLVLCARLAGDHTRALWLRTGGAAGCVPLGAGLYLSLSRGAMAAAVVGLAVVLALAPTRSQLRAISITLPAAVLAAASSAAFAGFASLEGDLSQRKTEGLVMLAILLALSAVAALACGWAAGHERSGRLAVTRLSVAHRLPAVAAALIGITLVGLVVGGLGERAEVQVRGERQSSRLTSLDSRRYDYWRAGVDAFAADPLTGVGTAGFRAVWLRERPVDEAAVDAHSLPLETAAELGIPGLVALTLLIVGTGLAGRAALRRDSTMLAGAAAACIVWLLHAAIDWHWEMPAVTLPALVMAAALIAAADESLP